MENEWNILYGISQSWVFIIILIFATKVFFYFKFLSTDIIFDSSIIFDVLSDTVELDKIDLHTRGEMDDSSNKIIKPD